MRMVLCRWSGGQRRLIGPLQSGLIMHRLRQGIVRPLSCIPITAMAYLGGPLVSW